MPNIDLTATASAVYEAPSRVGAGSRNVELHRYAGHLQALGVADAEMEEACLRFNAGRLDPPLPEWEVRSCVRSAQRYRKGAGGRTGASGAPRGFLMDDPPKVAGRGRPDLLPDLSGMAPAEQAKAWVRACFDEGDVLCLVRDYRSKADEFRLLAGQLTGLVDGFDPLPRMLRNDRGMGWWATTNPLRSFDSPRADAEVGRFAAVGSRTEAVALPDGSVRTSTRHEFDVNAKAYHHALVECDSLPPAEQLERICALFLHGEPDAGRRPAIDAITWSGGKSYHVMVRCGGSTRDEYDDRVRWLYAYCDANGLPVDHHCGNPSRLTRLPGASRGGEMQGLVWCRGL